VRAVQFDVSPRGFLLARFLGKLTDSVYFGKLSGLRLTDVGEPRIPGAGWVRLKVISSGICGSDVGYLTYSSSYILEPFGSFPAVLGHEILATVVEVGPGVTRVAPGQRVAVDPMVDCAVRGFREPCTSCAQGLPATCAQAGEEGEMRIGGSPLSAGITMGYHRDLPGGWGETMIAHEDHLYPVPDGLSDQQAVLTEPVAIGVHAALRSPPDPGTPVLVIGSGPIALGTIWALRATGFQGYLVAQTKRKHEAELALALGASRVVRPGLEARDAMVDTGAMAYQPILGPEVFAGGGFPMVFDCVGSGSSLQQALTFASPRGRIVMLGCVSQIPKLDLTFVWSRELEIKGFVGYGKEEWRGETRHTFEITHALMEETGAPLHELVTHVFPLDQYRDALRAAANHRRSGAIKVVLKP
jgi:threonine dehydrogenase-like Zn-dependent dehydrogenase